MDKIQFLKGMKYLGTMYDKSFTEEKIGLMYNLFENDDYDVYKQNGNPNYLDGSKVCDVSKMPLTDKRFWKLIKKKFEEHIK